MRCCSDVRTMKPLLLWKWYSVYETLWKICNALSLRLDYKNQNISHTWLVEEFVTKKNRHFLILMDAFFLHQLSNCLPVKLFTVLFPRFLQYWQKQLLKVENCCFSLVFIVKIILFRTRAIFWLCHLNLYRIIKHKTQPRTY